MPDLGGLAQAAILIVIIGLILFVGAVVNCGMKANDATAQKIVDSNCQTILNFVKFIPVLGDLAGE